MVSFIPLQFSHSVGSDSLRPHGLQHVRPPCPSLTPGAFSNSCPWVTDASKHLILCCSLSSWLQSFSASGSFPRSQYFALGGQSIGVSASASVLPMSIQNWFLDWFDLLAVQGTLKSLLQHHRSETLISLALNLLYGPILTSILDYWKNHRFV